MYIKIKTEKFTGPNKVLMVLGRRTCVHREDFHHVVLHFRCKVCNIMWNRESCLYTEYSIRSSWRQLWCSPNSWCLLIKVNDRQVRQLWCWPNSLCLLIKVNDRLVRQLWCSPNSWCLLFKVNVRQVRQLWYSPNSQCLFIKINDRQVNLGILDNFVA